MRLPRMTTRRLMIAVLAVGPMMAGAVEVIRLSQAAERYRAIARVFSEEAMGWKASIKKREIDTARWRTEGEEQLADMSEKFKSSMEIHESEARRRQLKYQYAASHPWFSKPPGGPGSYFDGPSMRAATQTLLGIKVIVGSAFVTLLIVFIFLWTSRFQDSLSCTTDHSVNGEV
jgi:hypothetical protein